MPEAIMQRQAEKQNPFLGLAMADGIAHVDKRIAPPPIPAYGKKEDDQGEFLSVKEETMAQLTLIIRGYTAKERQNETKGQITKRRLDGVVLALRSNVNLDEKPAKALTPQELAEAIIKAKNGEAPPPPATCFELSFLANEVLKSENYGYDSSVISIHRIDEKGLRISSGHATAAVVANGWLVDPAQFSTAKKVDDFVIEKGKEGYTETHDKIFNLYSPAIPASFYEFTIAKGQNQLEADFYYIRGQREGNFEDTKRAYASDPHNLFAACDIGTALRHEGKGQEALNAYENGLAGKENLYYANFFVGNQITQIQSTDDREVASGLTLYVERGVELIKESLRINPKSKIALARLHDFEK